MSEIQIPQSYLEKSKILVKAYEDFVFCGESLDKIITEMREILTDAGFSKTQAMRKISEDHKHLRGFSINNIYKALPKDEKQSYEKKDQEVEDSSITNFSQFVKTNSQNNVTEESSATIEDGIIVPDENRDRSNENKIHIQTAYEIQEAESTTSDDDDDDQEQNEPFSETQNYINQIREFDTTKQLLVQAREKIEEQDKKINELEIQLAKIDRTKRNENEIKQGTYTLEIKDKIIPLIWKYIPLADKMEITFDIQKARRMGL